MPHEIHSPLSSFSPSGHQSVAEMRIQSDLFLGSVSRMMARISSGRRMRFSLPGANEERSVVMSEESTEERERGERDAQRATVLVGALVRQWRQEVVHLLPRARIVSLELRLSMRDAGRTE